MEVDVAIIGAGPAGSTLAALLARRGASVALIDRDVFPRDKLCGEFLSYDALPVLDRLGLVSELDRLGASLITDCRLVTDGATFEFPLPAPSRGISRLALDQLLFENAVKAGAERLDGWSANRVSDNTVEIRKGEDRRDIKAQLVVGAWGRWGRIDRLLERRFVTDRTHRFFGFKRHYRGHSPDGVIELYSFRRGYLGVSHVESGATNICGLVHHTRLSGLKGGWPRFTDELAAEQRSLRKLFDSHQPIDDEFLSSEPVIFVAKSPVENGIFMLGDAAGIIDPLTGNGMAIALQSAFIALPPVLARLAGSAAAEDQYRSAFRQFFASRLRWSRGIAALLANPTLLTSLLRLHPPRSIGGFLTRRTRADVRLLDSALSGEPV